MVPENKDRLCMESSANKALPAGLIPEHAIRQQRQGVGEGSTALLACVQDPPTVNRRIGRAAALLPAALLSFLSHLN